VLERDQAPLARPPDDTEPEKEEHAHA